ncbi:hypothetical protein DFJ69_3467 [Thermomonospora umbrina]|uniref:Uncharacterized protein n=1 Tax=Thermomonospora umbrina TaxID=111806 RepID=A0A3D9SQT8_9ACTN|nr:hypothetical protein DFJ69_3467 [Thermomonospora umbrina]
MLLPTLTAAGLIVDAVVHWTYAPDLAAIEGGVIGGDTLFRVQAVVAAVAAVAVLVRTRRWTYAVAFVVAAGAVGALLFYYHVDVGALGPLPAMHEPVWYPEKTISLVGEGVAALAASAGLLLERTRVIPRE